MKHNNQLPNTHLRKHWQFRVKTWFDQPARKQRRRLNRLRKAAAVAPRPLDALRPAVRCPTIRYNTKLRAGRGFTLEEVKAAGLTPLYARTIGIAVDHRRRNKSVESLELNTNRLKTYLDKLVLFPKKNAKKVRKDETALDADVKVVPARVNAFPVTNELVVAEPSRAVSSSEQAVDAYKTSRAARHKARKVGLEAKRALRKLEAAETKGKK